MNSFLAAHGRYDERVRITGPTLKTIDARLSALEDEVHQLSSPQLSTTVGDQSTTSRQLDDARARIVDLEEALARSHFLSGAAAREPMIHVPKSSNTCLLQ